MSKTRSKRQFLSKNVRHAYRGPRSAPRGNRAAAHLDFRTKTDHGQTVYSPKMGRPIRFPIFSDKSILPTLNVNKLRFKHPTPSQKELLTSLEKQAINEQKKTILNGQKGWIIGLRFSGGSSRQIPVIANSWEEAVYRVQPRIAKENIDKIEELTIVDPSLKEIAHAVSGAARKAAGFLAKGISRMPRYARAAAREAGRITAIPKRLEQEYELGREEMAGAPVSAARASEEAALAEGAKLQRIGTYPELHEAELGAARPQPPKPEYTGEQIRRVRDIQERMATREREYSLRKPTPSEVKRKRRSSRRPFQSRVPWGSDET